MRSRITLFTLILFAAFTLYSTFSVYLGLPYPLWLTPLSTAAGFGFALLHSWQTLGGRRALLLLALTFSVSLAFESVGVATGLIYGPYHYTHKLGPKFLGLVPLLIPLAWFMMMYPAYLIAARLLPPLQSVWRWRLAAATLAGIAMTAWDVAMDPMMAAGEHWVWEVEGAFFGVPLQNYWGWWLTTFVTFALFVWLGNLRPAANENQPAAFDRLAVICYTLTGFSSVMVDLRIGLGGAGLAGIFAMLPWILMGFIRLATPQPPGTASQPQTPHPPAV